VLVVGDSMTFGLGVEREEAFPAVLEKWLGAELGRPIEVVNAGVTCWGQREEVAFLQHRAPALEPDLVLLQFTVANDVLDNLRYEDTKTGSDGPAEPLAEDGDLIPDPRLGADLAQHPIFTLPLADTSRAWRLFAWHIGRHVVRYRAMVEPWRLERTRLLIRKARDVSAKLGARFALVVAPTIVQVEDGLAETILRTRRINDGVLRRATEDGIQVFDPLPLLKSARAKSELSYFPRDMHWNAHGHELIGRALADWLAPQLR
jgi:lysophospholipase L1-like esterase